MSLPRPTTRQPTTAGASHGPPWTLTAFLKTLEPLRLPLFLITILHIYYTYLTVCLLPPPSSPAGRRSYSIHITSLPFLRCLLPLYVLSCAQTKNATADASPVQQPTPSLSSPLEPFLRGLFGRQTPANAPHRRDFPTKVIERTKCHFPSV